MLNQIDVQIPGLDFLVEVHAKEATSAIEGMSPSRAYGAETNLKSWRRVLTAIDPAGKDGYAFSGHLVRAGETVSLPIGSLIVSVDTSWAKANWYAGDHIAPLERAASLLCVTEAGLSQLLWTNSRTWAEELLGHLMTNRELLDAAGIVVKGERQAPLVKPRTKNCMFRVKAK